MLTLDELAGTIERTPVVLTELLRPVDPAALRAQPEPGEWCVLEVVGHLITADGPAFRDRITAILDGTGEIAGFHPAGPMEGRDFAAEPLDALLAELVEERAVSVHFVRDLARRHDSSALDRTGRHAKHGEFAARDFLLEWPFHDHDHVMQILAALKPAYLAGMTDRMRAALLA